MERALAPADRVLPSLLDRLAARDDERPIADDGLRKGQFQDSIERDLIWLFNASSPLGFMDRAQLARYPQVGASVLNFGLRGTFGRVVADLGAIEREVTQALERFEPRVRVERKTLRVTQEGQLVEIELEGTLLARGATRHLWVRTDLETLSSQVQFDSNG